MFTYEDLMDFVEANDYQRKPFVEVIRLYEKEMKECYEEMRITSYLSLETHELELYD